MKIAIVEPYIGGLGGAQKVISEYTSFLKTKGHEVEIFTCRKEKSPYSKFNKIKINVFGYRSKYLSAVNFLFKKIKGFDIIIANDFPSYLISIFNKNVVWVCYSPKRDFYDLKDFAFKNANFKGKLIHLIKRLFLKKIDLISARRMKVIFAISKNVESRILKYYNTQSRIFYPGIYNSVYFNKDYNNNFLSVARFVPPKRVENIVRAMEHVKDKRAKLLVIGEGGDKEKIVNLCKNKDNIKFIGKVSEKKLKDLYARCRAVIYVPVDEDWGLVPLEAAASGKTTIGVNEGGLKEYIINNKNGFLLENPSPVNIAKKIDLLMGDKQLAKKMGGEAKKGAEKFNWINLLPKFEKEISQIKRDLV